MTKEQTALDIARRMAELGERSHSVTAYTLALADARDRQPETELEAALYLFENGGNYKVAYDAFRSLYRRGFQRETLLELMTQAFYQPNIKLLKSRYEKNCRLLRKYPYCFQQDFPAFEELPLRFYPYDDQRYIPFTAETETFGEPLDLRHPVVSRNFFQNLDKPVLAADVYSQYELEYLRDNVRKSEWVGRENHVYLHYTDWETFCAYLQVLNLRPLLAEEKLVFLIGDEISQYPIDFQARFGMDYSQYPVKPVGIREIHRLIWHTQLSSHNGGDFFNEIFDNHPNLIAVESRMLYQLRKQVIEVRQLLSSGRERSPLTAVLVTGIWRSPSGWRISSAVCGQSDGQGHLRGPVSGYGGSAEPGPRCPNRSIYFFPTPLPQLPLHSGRERPEPGGAGLRGVSGAAGLLPPQGLQVYQNVYTPAPSHHLHRGVCAIHATPD